MDKLISEHAAIDALMVRDKELRNINWYDKPYAEGECRGIDEALAIVSNLPAVQPERKTGKWIWQTCSRYMCSECGRITDVDECMEEPMYTYCPYCGVPMVAGKKML